MISNLYFGLPFPIKLKLNLRKMENLDNHFIPLLVLILYTYVKSDTNTILKSLTRAFKTFFKLIVIIELQVLSKYKLFKIIPRKPPEPKNQ